MLRAVIKKEMLEHLVSFRFIVCTVTLLTLAVLAAFVGVQDLELRNRSYRAIQSQVQQDLGRVHVYSDLEPVVARAPEPLSVLDRGFDAQLGTAVELDVFEIPVRATELHRGNELTASARDLDLTTIIRLIGGLMALLLTFDAISGERERGTLRLIFANGIARPRLYLGKWAGAFLALMIPLFASLGATVWILLAQDDVTLGPERWLRLASMAAAYVVYLCVMLTIGLLLSVLTRTASTSLLYSLLVWLAIVFLIPQSAVAVASASSGIDSAQTGLRGEIRALEKQRDRELHQLQQRKLQAVARESREHAPYVEAEGRRVLYRYGTARYYEARADYHREEVAVGRDYAREIYGLEQRAREVDRRAESLGRWLSLASPAYQLDRLSESLAGTSLSDHDEFLASCRAYRESFLHYLESKQAFSSWRWFTDDDPAALRPWTAIAGFPPPVAAATDDEVMIERFQSLEVQQLVQQDKESRAEDPKRWLELGDLPRAELPTLRLPEALARVKAELLTLLTFNGALVVAGLRRFRAYTLS